MDQPMHYYAYPSPLGLIMLGIRAGALALLDLPGEGRPSSALSPQPRTLRS